MANKRENNLVPLLPTSENESSSQDLADTNKSSTSELMNHLHDLPKRTFVRVTCHGCRRRRIRVSFIRCSTSPSSLTISPLF